MRYPPEVYCIREDVTRENMRKYDEYQKRLKAKCLELDSNYYSLGLRERMDVLAEAKMEIQ